MFNKNIYGYFITLDSKTIAIVEAYMNFEFLIIISAASNYFALPINKINVQNYELVCATPGGDEL